MGLWGCLWSCSTLFRHSSKIDWKRLSVNPNAINLLLENPDKIDWNSLSKNSGAIQILEKNLDKVDWYQLSRNPNAIHILKKNHDKIDWNTLSVNSSIFNRSVNYEFLKERMDIIREELMIKCMHPSRLERWIEMGGEIEDF